MSVTWNGINEQKFWARVHRREPDQCWPYLGAIHRTGYGRFSVRGANGSRRLLTAHRVSYALVNGDIPEGLLVCHTCDNRSCVNPNHLFLGTDADNARDRDKKGRLKYSVFPGETHHNAKLTNEDVMEIRERARSGELQSAIAERFRICSSQVSQIVNRKRWRHV
jgi:hypothetical protein